MSYYIPQDELQLIPKEELDDLPRYVTPRSRLATFFTDFSKIENCYVAKHKLHFCFPENSVPPIAISGVNDNGSFNSDIFECEKIFFNIYSHVLGMHNYAHDLKIPEDSKARYIYMYIYILFFYLVSEVELTLCFIAHWNFMSITL